MTVNTTTFQASHGTTPRGFGQWFFEVSTGQTFTFTGKFSDAKKAAQEWARQNKFTDVKVMA